MLGNIVRIRHYEGHIKILELWEIYQNAVIDMIRDDK